MRAIANDIFARAIANDIFARAIANDIFVRAIANGIFARTIANGCSCTRGDVDLSVNIRVPDACGYGFVPSLRY